MSRKIVQQARSLRKRQTPWEIELWYHLRNRQLNGLKFRRQYPIGKYIVDFCCIEKRLVIELDGSGHMNEKQINKDKERDIFLQTNGWEVLRMWNSELNENLEGVLNKILELTKQPSPQPSPKGRGSMS